MHYALVSLLPKVPTPAVLRAVHATTPTDLQIIGLIDVISNYNYIAPTSLS
jgi:hypothetical protein